VLDHASLTLALLAWSVSMAGLVVGACWLAGRHLGVVE